MYFIISSIHECYNVIISAQFVLTSCLNASRKDAVEEDKIEIDRLYNRIAELENELSESYHDIQLLEELTSEIYEIEIPNINSYFSEDEFQSITGIKLCSDTILRLTPYSDSVDLGRIEQDEVKIISTGKNDSGESWALVEVLGRFKDEKYGYVRSDSLSDEVSGKFDYDKLDIIESINSIAIGDNMEEIIDAFGRDYYLVKDSNAYQIGYSTDDNGGHIVFTIDNKVLRVRGIRTTSKDYPISNGISIGLPWSVIHEVYNDHDIRHIENRYIVKLNNDFIMQLQLSDNELDDVAKIIRIDIEPDWHDVFD